MKQKLLVLFIVPMLLFTGCSLFKGQAQPLVMEELGLDISDATVDFFLNTRKDSADGITVVKATFPDASFSRQLENKEGFQPLPLSEKLTNALHSIDLLQNENGELLFPHAENGYYKIALDFENGKEEPFTLDQGADLIIAIFNADTQKFHYYHLGIDNMNLLKELQALIKAK